MKFSSHLIGTFAVAAFAAFALPAAAQNTPTEAANKKMVVEFYERVLFKMDSDAATQYIGDKYIQHNPNVPDGVQALQAFVAKRKADGAQNFSSIKRAFADGDFVILHVHSVSAAGDRGRAIVDLFRVENGKIVEHWDVVQPVPEKAANNNTMF